MPHEHVFFDLETTHERRPQIIQLAAIAVNESLDPIESIELKVHFEVSKRSQGGLMKRNFSRRRWANEALPSREAAFTFGQFLRRYSEGKQLVQLVAHHAAFDAPLLQKWFREQKLFLPARFHVLCTLQRAQWFFAERPDLEPPRNFQLATLCQYFKVPFHAASAHDALGDVSATVGLYQALSHVAHECCRATRVA